MSPTFLHYNNCPSRAKPSGSNTRKEKYSNIRNISELAGKENNLHQDCYMRLGKDVEPYML